MSHRPTATTPKNSGSGIAWLIAIVGGLIVLANVSKCSPGTSTRTAAEVAASDPMIKALSSAVAAQTPPAVQPLNAGAVTAGLTNMRKSVTAEGLSGAMIYSQNCYDALSRAYSWRLLDVCGAADLKAVASVPEEEIVGLDKEIAYFQSEIAAARYLGAATGAGASTDEADKRLAKMQERVPHLRSKTANNKDINAFQLASEDDNLEDTNQSAANSEATTY